MFDFIIKESNGGFNTSTIKYLLIFPYSSCADPVRGGILNALFCRNIYKIDNRRINNE